MTTGVRFEPAALLAIAAHGGALYPFEACGALFGLRAGIVTASRPLLNSDRSRPRVRFRIAPRDYLLAEMDAESRGLVLVGFWHTHPNRAPLPSSTDRLHAWERLLTVIVSVRNGEAREIAAWKLMGANGHFTSVPVTCEAANGDRSRLSRFLDLAKLTGGTR